MKEFSFEVDGFVVHVYCSDLDAKVLLLEAQHRGIPLTGAYSAQYHRAHTSPGQNHIHVFCKNNQLFALNRDGTAHNQSHGVPIPNKVVKAIRQKFPDIQIPANNLIEAASHEDEVELLIESPKSDVKPQIGQARDAEIVWDGDGPLRGSVTAAEDGRWRFTLHQGQSFDDCPAEGTILRVASHFGTHDDFAIVAMQASTFENVRYLIVRKFPVVEPED